MVQVEGAQWDLIFRADIIDGWYVYSQQSFGEAGPMPTTLKFDTLPHVTLAGNATETGAHVVEGHDAVFDMPVKKFKGFALFTQRVALTGPPSGSPPVAVIRLMPFPQASAASDEPVQWKLSARDLGSGRWALAFTAIVRDGWYVYSQEAFGDGPIPTSIVFDTVPHFAVEGGSTEEGAGKVEGHDPIFEMNVRKFKGTVVFTRTVRVDDPQRPVTGSINYMSCNDEACVFPDPLAFSIVPSTGAAILGGAASGSDLAVLDGPM